MSFTPCQRDKIRPLKLKPLLNALYFVTCLCWPWTRFHRFHVLLQILFGPPPRGWKLGLLARFFYMIHLWSFIILCTVISLHMSAGWSSLYIESNNPLPSIYYIPTPSPCTCQHLFAQVPMHTANLAIPICRKYSADPRDSSQQRGSLQCSWRKASSIGWQTMQQVWQKFICSI